MSYKHDSRGGYTIIIKILLRSFSRKGGGFCCEKSIDLYSQRDVSAFAHTSDRISLSQSHMKSGMFMILPLTFMFFIENLSLNVGEYLS